MKIQNCLLIAYSGRKGSKGVPLHSETTLVKLEKVLVHAIIGGKSPILLSQYNFYNNTPHLVMRNIVLEECNEFLEKSTAVPRGVKEIYSEDITLSIFTVYPETITLCIFL